MDANTKANLLSMVITGFLKVNKVLSDLEETLDKMTPPTSSTLEEDLQDIVDEVVRKENAADERMSEEVYCTKLTSPTMEAAITALATEVSKMDKEGWVAHTITSHWEWLPEEDVDRKWWVVTYITYS